ncbi:hypothetical protein F4553_004459 [Allocatelliglobosispora scoriae]|uniref:LamG domain-containing protein n=1 Tax=Allocatelliglobosispora scoriae TaxID=643052 RepID=A0A841BWF9_9ACTN|nr:LamG-like jellyroll fold domain-containing protein [Allocatelliglobosispora scoriae]MBB5871080.1 hypothetical protein [Allocatelliglobosispora scoriae]
MGRLRRSWVLLAAGVVAAILFIAITSTDRRDAETELTQPGGTVGVPVNVLEPTADLSVSLAPGATPSALPAPLAPFTIFYDLDQGLDHPIWDIGRLLPLHHQGVRDGKVRRVSRDVGNAALFPGLCEAREESQCPRAILESDSVPWLNPGARDLRWGALVRLRGELTTEGENIVQKGRSTAGTQFKLQVDHRAGLPSCVVAGPVLGVNRIFVAQRNVTVADGAWHTLDCTRVGGTLSLLVDGVVASKVAVPAGLSIVNDEPLRIGGKGVAPGNDQFHGVLDNIYVTIG